MKAGAVFLILFILAIMAGIVVWAISRAQRLSRAQYGAMILVAKSRGLRFVDDPDPMVRVRMDGQVDGVEVRVRALTIQMARQSAPVLEVSARGRHVPGPGVVIRRSGMANTTLMVDGDASAREADLLKQPEVRRLLLSATDPIWAGTSGEGAMDHTGVWLRKSGHQGDPDIIEEMLRRAVAAALAFDKACKN